MHCAAAIAVGFILIASKQAATAGHSPTVRDHRDGKQVGGGSEGGVTVNGKPTKATKAPKLPVGNGTQSHGNGYGGLGNDPSKGASGITVRDHR